MANSSEEIIEKRASSPVATSALVISALALVGAIVLQVMEIGELRAVGDGVRDSDRNTDSVAATVYRRDSAALETRARAILDANKAAFGEGGAGAGDAGDDAGN